MINEEVLKVQNEIVVLLNMAGREKEAAIAANLCSIIRETVISSPDKTILRVVIAKLESTLISTEAKNLLTKLIAELN